MINVWRKVYTDSRKLNVKRLSGLSGDYPKSISGFSKSDKQAYVFEKYGAGYKVRTRDPLITNQVLYQLS